MRGRGELGRRGGEGSGALLMVDAPEVLGAKRVLGEEPGAYAKGMYDALHELEDAGCREVLVEEVPGGGEWDAIRDRLTRLSIGS